MCSLSNFTPFFEGLQTLNLEIIATTSKFGEDVVFMIQNIVLAQNWKIMKNDVMAAILNLNTVILKRP